MGAKVISTYDVCQWPEWRAFATRLGIDLNLKIRRVKITLETHAPVHVELAYWPEEEGLNDGPL